MKVWDGEKVVDVKCPNCNSEQLYLTTSRVYFKVLKCPRCHTTIPFPCPNPNIP